MNLKLHNKIEIEIENKKYVYYNSMLKSVRQKLINLESFNDYIAFGTNGDNHLSSNYYLNEYYKSYKLETEFLQSDISLGSGCFIKKTVIIDDSSIDGVYLKEAGITDSKDNNPTIYNYFSLISDECPNGIIKESGKPLVVSITIYLEINNLGDALLISGKNKFIEFLLGNGINENIYAIRGNCRLENLTYIDYYNMNQNEKFKCNLEIVEQEDSLSLIFKADMGSNSVTEIVFLIEDIPVVRINLLDYKENIELTSSFTSNSYGTIDMGEDIKNISTIIKSDTSTLESKCVISNYANNFGDKIFLPFHNLFDNQTPRYLSKDGKLIFFIKDGKLYAYKNENYRLTEIKTYGVIFENIINIISFDKYVFIISKSAPFINAYIIENNELLACSFSLNDFSEKDIIGNIYKVDATLGKNNYFMIGFIDDTNRNGYVLYLIFDRVNKLFYVDYYDKYEYEFTNVLSLYKSNFADAFVMFYKSDTSVYESKIVYFYQDKTTSELSSTPAYNILNDTKEIYLKNRCLVVEKVSSPHIYLYFYPEFKEHIIDISNNEINDYFSSNMHYLLQKIGNGNYKFYNLINFEKYNELDFTLSDIEDYTSILDFEFLNDTLLIFLDNSEKIVGYNLLNNRTVIENLSMPETNYDIKYTKYDLIGKNNEGVIVSFITNINI